MLRAGCAFVSYCGPFNQEFRDYIVTKKLTADLRKKDVPCSPSLDVISLLVDVSETSDWALAGLPGAGRREVLARHCHCLAHNGRLYIHIYVYVYHGLYICLYM